MYSLTRSERAAIPIPPIIPANAGTAFANGITKGAANNITSNKFFQYEEVNPLLNLLDAPRTLLV